MPLTTSWTNSSAQHKTWLVSEEGYRALPGFRFEWLPNQASRYVTLRVDRQGLVAAKSEQYVGALPLLNGDTLRLLPKIGMKAFGRMLLVAECLENALGHEFSSLVASSTTDGDSASWLALLARGLVSHLGTIDAMSPSFGRARTAQRLDFVRGRVDATRTSLSIERGDSRPVHCTVENRTTDTPENRFLGSAANAVLRTQRLSREDRLVASRWAARFSGRTTPDDIEHVSRRMSRGDYSGSRSYYQPAMAVAFMILNGGDISLAGEPTVNTEALVVSSSTLFERYVRSVISKYLSPLGFVVAKGVQPPLSLLDDGRYTLIPDISISLNGKLRLLVDAKYKTGGEVPVADYYQLISYARAYALRKVALVMPSVENDSNATRVIRRSFDSIEVAELRMNLDDWSATEAWLAEEVRVLALK